MFAGFCFYMPKKDYSIFNIEYPFIKIIKEREDKINGSRIFLCECICGKLIDRTFTALKYTLNVNCGCKNLGRNKTHGLRQHPLYSRWAGIKKRCYNPNYIDFHLYGGKGIKMCDEWKNDFKAFYDWAITHGFSEELVIDREFGDKDYCPENCRWITDEESSNNLCTNVKYEFNGKMLGIYQISRLVGIYDETLRDRVVNQGMSVYEAVAIGTNRKKRKDIGKRKKIGLGRQFCIDNGISVSYFYSKKAKDKLSVQETIEFFINKINKRKPK